MRKFLRNNFLLLSIVFLAFGLRVYKLDSIPHGLHEDEVMNGYVGRYILQNGKDLYGNRWPLFYFDNFGDYPNVIPMYLSGLSTYVFGVSDFAIRFPIALAGTLSVIPVYLLGTAIFDKKKYALISAFFLAILPWHIMLSRSTAENVTATLAYLFVLCFLLLFRKKRKLSLLVGSSVLAFATYFLYPSYRLIIPLTYSMTCLLMFKEKKTFFRILLVVIFFVVFTFFISKTVWGQGRFRQTSILYFNGMVTHRLQTYIFGIKNGNLLETRLFYNKLVGYTREFIRQYLSYFSPNFLFTDAGKPDRYRLSDTGIMYVAFLGIVILGIGILIFEKQRNDTEIFTADGKKNFLYILLILLISVIPSALTLDDIPNLHRSLPLGIFSLFFVTYCLSVIDAHKKIRKLALGTFSLVLLLESIYFWHHWMAFSPTDQAVFRDQGRADMAKYLIANHARYDKVFLTKNSKVLFYLFYGQNFDPSLTGKFSFNIYTDQLENLYFEDGNCVTSLKDLPISTSSLVVESSACPETGNYLLKQIDTIHLFDTNPAFNIFIATGSANRK